MMSNSPIKVFLAAFLTAVSIPVLAQLPAGTQDASAAPADPTNALLSEANEALQRRDFPAAQKLLTRLTAAKPNDAHLLFDLGLTEENLDHNDAAETAYRKAIGADANYAAPHLALGLMLARSDHAAEARGELTAATTVSSDDPAVPARALRALARIDVASDAAGARDELLAALKLSPETPDDVLLSAQIAESLGDLPLAETAYRRSLAEPENRDDPAVVAALAHVLLQQKKSGDAESALTAALKTHPGDTVLTAQLATAYLAEDNPAKSALAVPLAETLHTQHPENAAVTRLLARLYAQTKQPEKAEPLYAALVAQTPTDPTLLDDTGSNLLHLKRFAEAEEVLKRAVAQPVSAFPSPDDRAAAYSDLAFSASENNDPTITLQALELRATVAPNTAGSLFLLATAHDKLHQVKQASEAYRQFLELANGKFPDQEWEAKHRLIALEHMK
jgi:Tfp pilus assembly protein PilF